MGQVRERSREGESIEELDGGKEFSSCKGIIGGSWLVEAYKSYKRSKHSQTPKRCY